MLDIKYRPLRFSDVLGQAGTVQLLKTRVKKNSVLDTSYIFSGLHGGGKTTLSRILARSAICLDLNTEECEPCNACDNCQDILNERSEAFLEKDAASGGTIENMRSMVDDLPFAVANAAKRIWLLDEAHRLSPASQDLLLKPLEEKKVVGIFCTTEPDKIRGAIRSRCEEYTIRKAPREEVLARVQMICQKEGISFEDDALLTIIDYSGGHIRDVLKRLDMVAQLGNVSNENVKSYLNLGAVSTYYQILISLGDTKKTLDLLDSILDKVQPEDAAAGLAEACMNSFRLANGMYADFVYIDRALAQQVYTRFQLSTVKMAEYFLRSRYISATGLICDLLALCEGNVPDTTPKVIAPPVSITSVSSAHIAPLPAAVPVSVPIPTPIPKPTPASTIANGVRTDGVGPLGSSDSTALTVEDHKGVPQAKPRGRTDIQELKIDFGRGQSLDSQTRKLTPDEWKREFDRTYFGR